VTRVVGLAAVAAPALHLLSDVMEWIAGGFTRPPIDRRIALFMLIAVALSAASAGCALNGAQVELFDCPPFRECIEVKPA
jgi:hypothetical protein